MALALQNTRIIYIHKYVKYLHHLGNEKSNKCNIYIYFMYL